MKVRVAFTVNVDDHFRRALRAWFGGKGLATRDDVRSWFEQNSASCDADMLQQYEDEAERHEKSGEGL